MAGESVPFVGLLVTQGFDLGGRLQSAVGHDFFQHANALLQLFFLAALICRFLGRPTGDDVELLALKPDHAPAEADPHGRNWNKWPQIH